MEEEELAHIVGQNITRLRKIANMTQLELAEKLNYSDKSVSKWEQGNGVPDVRTLVQLSTLFGVSVDDLVREHTKSVIMPKKTKTVQRIITMICAAGLCWLTAVVLYVLLGIFTDYEGIWLAFMYAVPASAIVVLVFSCIWRWKWMRIVSLSVLVWTLLAVIYLTVYICGANIWLIFLIGVPLQILALFYFVWRKEAHFRG